MNVSYKKVLYEPLYHVTLGSPFDAKDDPREKKTQKLPFIADFDLVSGEITNQCVCHSTQNKMSYPTDWSEHHLLIAAGFSFDKNCSKLG